MTPGERTPPDPSERAWPFFRTAVTLALLGLVLLLAWLGLRHGGLGRPQPRILVVYCFSTLDQVMQDALLPAFRARWLADHGEPVEVVTSYAGSGDLTERIIRRYPAQIAILSSAIEAYRLAGAGPLRWKAWENLPHKGVLSRSRMLILVREGNPRGILDYADLARPGVTLVHADPATSGGANWAILGTYATALRRTGDPELAYRQLLAVWRNVVAQAPSARDARARFERGEGDALLDYEHDLLANPRHPAVGGQIVVPPDTILAEHVVAPIAANIGDQDRELVAAFLDFLWSPEAQRLLVAYGLHSVDAGLDAANPQLGALADTFTLADLGGPTAARRDILEAVWRDRVLPALGR